MLYPQYGDKFNNISQESWERLQDKAKENLKNKTMVHEDVRQHWEDIAIYGEVPFGYTVREE